MTVNWLEADTQEVAMPCGPCTVLDCRHCRRVVIDGAGPVLCPCAEAGHEESWDDDEWQGPVF